jgi:hypothetical protein
MYIDTCSIIFTSKHFSEILFTVSANCIKFKKPAADILQAITALTGQFREQKSAFFANTALTIMGAIFINIYFFYCKIA